MITELISGLSAAAGPVIGLIGSGIGAFAKHKNELLNIEKMGMQLNQEIELHKLQIEAGKAETESEIQLANATGSWEGLAASIRHDRSLSSGVSQWVANVRALFRPFLTLLLLVVVAVFAFRGIGDLNYLVNTLVAATSAAIMWWFGDRSMSPPSRK